MRWRTVAAVSVLLPAHALAVYAIAASMSSSGSPNAPGPPPSPGVPVPAATTSVGAQVENFPDAHDEAPPNWTGAVFRLSQAYPQTMPGLGDTPWRAIDFKQDPVAYVEAVLRYALEGNTEVDFRGQDNPVRKWFHAPWLHAGPNGREFIHGMTHERVSRPKELAPTQTDPAQNWAVGMYNPRGGFVVGQVWQNRDNPDPTKAEFPEGTVAFKLLFTSASVQQVPFLKGSLEWQADINRTAGTTPPPTLRLLQIDVAVRDSRADDTTGWVFGTFIYDGDAPGDTVWKRMVPVGAMWGNDPERLDDDGPLQETAINPAAQPLVQHLGYKGRLNGPVDNPGSSCLSCHSTAEIPTDLSRPNVPGVPPAPATPTVLAQYFRNIKAHTPFTDGEFALDYSLQLQNGIANWARETGVKFPPPAVPGALAPPRRILRASKEIAVVPVERK